MKIGIISFLSILMTFTIYAQNWEEIGNPPFQTDHSNGFGYNGKGYIIEGSSQGQSNNRVWEYTAATNTWSQITSFPGTSRGFAIGDSWNDKYYFGFGYGGNNGILNDLWEFNPVDLSFTQLPSCPCEGRGHPALIAHNDKIFIGAGSGNNDDLEDWWVYDMLSQEWTQKEDVPGGLRHHPFFFGLENKVYIGGGHQDSWWAYDMDMETWTAIDDLPQGRVAGTQFNFQGKGFVLGGDDADHSHVPDDESFMMYDSELDKWKKLASLPNGSRWAPSSFIIDGQVFFFGGENYDVGQDVSMWKYDLSFLTCLPAQDLMAVDLTDSYAELFWDSSSNTADTLKWRKVGDPSWEIIVGPEVFYPLSGLETCQEYEFEIASACTFIPINSETYTFFTKGCGTCLDFDYCPPPALTGSAIDGYINEVKINDYVNTSGSDDGYGNFAVNNAESLVRGESFDLSVELGGNNFVYLIVWIDYNANGEFEDSELVWEEGLPSQEESQNILIPVDAQTGITRMRILHGWNSSANPCYLSDVSEQGEMEDYCINITDPELTSLEETDVSSIEFSVHPNPFKNTVKLNSTGQTNEKYQLSIVNMMGQTVRTINNFDARNNIDLSLLPQGIYFLKIKNELKEIEVIKLIKQI